MRSRLARRAARIRIAFPGPSALATFVALLAMGLGCRERHAAGSRATATAVATEDPSSAVSGAAPTSVAVARPRCAATLAEGPEPPRWQSFAVVAEMGSPVGVDTWNVDKYSGGTFEAPLLPFAVKYSATAPHPQCSLLEIREA